VENSLLATVHDKDGRVVKDLNQEDFLLLEDGKPQTVRYFSGESDLPLTLGLLMDTSRSQSGVPGAARECRPASIVSFDERVQVLQA
jgi:hypothetical protein